MRSLIIIGIVALVLLAVCISFYTAYTNSIIKDQEREIAKLETENKRLKSAIRGAQYVTKIVFSDKPLDYPATVKLTKPQERDY
jgi:Tfp pilus assembly protein PilN